MLKDIFRSNIVISSILASLLLTSCGGSGGGSATKVQESVDTLETDLYGTYQAVLSPLNPSVSGKINGSLTLVRDLDDFIVDVRLADAPPSILHTQSIHVGSRCPTSKDDLNQDGFLDAEEGAKVYGDIIIPLDDDLNSQFMGGGIYPLSDEFGYYFYSQIASYDRFLKDMHEIDINPADDLIKIAPNKSMTAIGKVIVIYGVPESVVLPDTVVGKPRLTNFEALPIACGSIHKVTAVPGEVDNDEGIPSTGPAPGGNGSDDGADFSHPLPNPDGPVGNYGEDGDPHEGPLPVTPPPV